MFYEEENNPPTCYICGLKTHIYCNNILLLMTKCSGTKIVDLLERFLGYSISATEESLRLLQSWIICQDCVSKLNDYDEAYNKANCIQAELTSLLKESMNIRMEDALEMDNDTSLIKHEFDMDNSSADYSSIEQPVDVKEDNEPVPVAVSKPVIMKCTTCNEVFKNLGDMKGHTHHKKRTTMVKQEVLNDESNYQNKFNDEDKVNMTLTPETPARKVRKPNSKPLTPHKCPKCGAEFLSRSEFKLHMKNHEENEAEKFVCDICGLICKTKTTLDNHTFQHDSNLSPHECTVCRKKFSQKGALVRHMPIHTGKKPYQCERCGKQFLHYSSFHMHQLAHDNIREKKCPICGFELRSNSHLTRHLRVHSGEKPFECPTCGQKFAQRYNMMTHLKAHQGIYRDYHKTYICPLCQTSFQKKFKLQEHLSLVHNTIIDPATIKATEKSKVPMKKEETIITDGQTNFILGLS